MQDHSSISSNKSSNAVADNIGEKGIALDGPAAIPVQQPVAQNKTQEIANNSSAVKQLKAYQQMADNSTGSSPTALPAVQMKQLGAIDALKTQTGDNNSGPVSYTKENNTAVSGPPVQRVSKIFAGSTEVTKADAQGRQAYEFLDIITNNFAGEIWFTSIKEMVDFIKSSGETEGIGIWNGRWMNFTGKGPIVFGEEHNEIRQEFIDKLHIKHYVVEGAFERSLTGVGDGAIPAHADPAHKKYSGAGDGGGKALENFWVRSGQGMSRFWVNFENNLKALSQGTSAFLPPIERLGELEEIMRTIAGVTPTPDQAGIAGEINAEISNAQFYMEKAKDCGLQILFDLNALERRSRVMAMDAAVKKVNARGMGLHYLYVCFSELRKSVEQIGYLNFQSQASAGDIEADELTKNSDDPFKVWGGRRELFMLKNLTHALAQSPKPLITTMGRAHALNQKDKIEALVNPQGGGLVIGTIVDLADIGALKK